MSIRVAYGQKSGIDYAIKSGNIPKGCLIVTKTTGFDSEFMFYDTNGAMKGITPTVKFASRKDLGIYLEENAEALRGEMDIAGRLITVLENGTYTPYLLQKDGELTPIQTETYINSVNGNQFNVVDGKLSLRNVPVERVTGLAELLDKITDREYVAKVSLDGNFLETDPEDNSVDIPMATAKTLGLVKHSNKPNAVSIREDGTMRVNTVSLDRLVDSEEGEVVIACGDSY